jgi:hypothetical protein
LRRRPIAIELFPAFARADAARSWHATVRVQFLLAREQVVADGLALSVAPGGRTALARAVLPNLAVPPDFMPLVEVRVRPARAPDVPAVRRVMAVSR